jgi:hypothetical protein
MAAERTAAVTASHSMATTRWIGAPLGATAAW